MRRLALLVLLLAGSAYGQKNPYLNLPPIPVVRDSSGIEGAVRETSAVDLQTYDVAIFGQWVRAKGRATADTTDLVLWALRSPDGTRYGAMVALDTLRIYGSRADTLHFRRIDAGKINLARKAKLVLQSFAGSTDTTDVQVWWQFIWTPNVLGR